MLNTHGIDRVGTRRILACPYCQRLQSIIPQPALFDIVCKNCQRVFRVTEAGAVAVVEAVRADDGAAPERSPCDRLRARPRGLRSVVIVVLALAAVVAATRLLMSLGEAHAVGRRP